MCAFAKTNMYTHKKLPLQYKYKQNTCIYIVHKSTHTTHRKGITNNTSKKTHCQQNAGMSIFLCVYFSRGGGHTVKCRSLPTKVGMVHGISKANINGKQIDVCNTVRWPNKCPQECSRWMFHKSNYKHASHNGDKPWHAGLWHAKTCVHPNKYVIKVMPMETCTHCYVCCTKSTKLYNAPQVLWHDNMTRRLYGDISPTFFKYRRQKKSIST